MFALKLTNVTSKWQVYREQGSKWWSVSVKNGAKAGIILAGVFKGLSVAAPIGNFSHLPKTPMDACTGSASAF